MSWKRLIPRLVRPIYVFALTVWMDGFRLYPQSGNPQVPRFGEEVAQPV
jgi:hypothetical protein